MIYASIISAEYHLPEKLLSNDELAKLFPEWPATKIEEKLGIVSRAIAADDEFSSDLAVKAAEKLFASGVCWCIGLQSWLLRIYLWAWSSKGPYRNKAGSQPPSAHRRNL
jgi:hypothetical protein